MTTEEFSLEFDIHYNSITGHQSPGIDLYEKSVFLSKAQLEIVKSYYSVKSNRKQEGFESSEKRRQDLKELIKDYKSSNSFVNDSNIHSQSRFFNIPDDVFLIINEKVRVISEGCDLNKLINIKPVTHDEFNIQIDNPFKNPDNRVAWRLDFSTIDNDKVVEIVSPFNIDGQLEYQLRYLKYPRPIILTDLELLYPGENLSIDGYTSEATCELSEEIHKEILDRAIEIALRDYSPQKLEAAVSTNLRNE